MVLQGGAGIIPHVGESLPVEGFTAMTVKPESPAADTKLATAHKSEIARQHLLRGSMVIGGRHADRRMGCAAGRGEEPGYIYIYIYIITQ